MFLKNFKKAFLLYVLLLFIIPLNISAYSDYLIPGGQTIGIKINSKGVLVVGTYKLDDSIKNQTVKTGDLITKVEDQEVYTIDEMVSAISKKAIDNKVNVTYVRANQTETTTLYLSKDNNNVYKTGLYVKDSISGLGTMTFIDPNTKLYGALGHEIIEKNSGLMLEVNNGSIFKSEVVGINKSNNGTPGEKNAKFYTNDVIGNIFENTNSGIFGNYTSNLPNITPLKVANEDEVKLGEAVIRTVLNKDVVEEFKINITKISLNNTTKTKNILFEITDERLLSKTGGIVQGMSGSPIIQDNKIIGAVTHVVVDDVQKGYGIYIKNMLEEAEN